MIDNEKDILENMDAAQVRFAEAHDEGYERGLRGEKYLSPFEAVPGLCSNPKDKMDRFVAMHYDRGYLTAYGHYLDQNPAAVEDIMFKRLVDKYCIVDRAQSLGIAAYQDGRPADAVVNEVYELLPGTKSDINLSVYDGWELGYALGLVYDTDRAKKITMPRFDYDRAYALASGVETKDTEEVPDEVAAAFRNAKNILEASEDDELMECLTCPYHYGVHSGDSCDRNCGEAADSIQLMIGTEDDVLREWLVLK